MAHRETIEHHLFDRAMGLFNLDQTIFFYDLTTTWIQKSALPGCTLTGLLVRRARAVGG